MRINALTGSSLIGLSKGRWHRLMAGHGLLPTGVEHVQGGPRYIWDEGQVFAMYVAQFLLRSHRVPATSVAGLINWITSIPDEQLDATIRSGRCWIMGVSQAIAPELFFKDNVESAAARLADGLKAVRAVALVINAGPLWIDLQSAIRAARERAFAE